MPSYSKQQQLDEYSPRPEGEPLRVSLTNQLARLRRVEQAQAQAAKNRKKTRAGRTDLIPHPDVQVTASFVVTPRHSHDRNVRSKSGRSTPITAGIGEKARIVGRATVSRLNEVVGMQSSTDPGEIIFQRISPNQAQSIGAPEIRIGALPSSDLRRAAHRAQHQSSERRIR